MDAVKQFLKLFLSWPVVLGAVGLAGVLLAVTLLGAYFLTPAYPIAALPTAVMHITPAPSATMILPTATVPQYQTPTSDLPPSPLPNVIAVGNTVQIFGTEGTGLNLRSAPGLNSEVRFLAYDAEVFEVRDGPRESDGFTWWYLAAPFDEERAGWAAANYLALVAAP